MKRTKTILALNLAIALFLSLASTASAQVDVGPATISGSIEADGLPRTFSGSKAKFEEYRDIPESVVVPQLQLFIDGKKNDFYAEFETRKPGRDDQYYKLRAGRYGLIDMEFEWDQIPHLFNVDTARTPYGRNGGSYTLGSKPIATTTPNTASLGNPATPVFPPAQGTPSTAHCNDLPGDAGNPFCQWLNANDHSTDLSLFNGIARFKVRYTPTPGWTFTGSYWSNHNVGKRSFGTLIGTSPGTYNIVELPEPIDYQTHNIELGAEYAGSWWTLGLKYNASLFHNGTSTLTWDNPVNLSNIDPITGLINGSCTDSQNLTMSATTGAITGTNWGPCRGRTDLYPSNQAHTITLTGTANLPMKTQFLSTVSYGWRLQDDNFLPFTTNTAIAGGTFATRALLPKNSLDGDVRPTMINTTLVNNFFEGLNLKAFHRYYELDNRTHKVTFNNGLIIGDTGSPAEVGTENRFMQYAKNTLGFEAGYSVTRWLNAKLNYGWENMHRSDRQVIDSSEHGFGPTLDIKPFASLLFRASYRHFWRDAPSYSDENDPINISRMFDVAGRNRDKVSLFTQYSPLDLLTLYAGFEFTNDRYQNSVLGLNTDINYSPSVGAIYSPLDWIRFFVDYNWDRFDWLLDGMQRGTLTQDPRDPATCDANCQLRLWTGRGREQIHTLSLGSDVTLIRDVLGFRIQYGFSDAVSRVNNSGSTCLSPPLPFPAAGACTPATDYPTIRNRWHEMLMRLEYNVFKNLSLKAGYYFNQYNTVDHGVDIMKQWMGDQDQWSITGNANLGRSIFLGDRLKGAYVAHVGLIGVKFSF